jgi:hypothetical protein
MSDSDKIRNELQNVHVQILGRNIDRKSLSYWISSINDKSKSICEFKTMLSTSDEYKNKLIKQFRNIYVDHIGFDISDNVIESFTIHIMEPKFANKPVNDKDVFDFIACLPEFIVKYTSIITNTYMLLQKNEINSTVCNFYLDCFKRDQVYTIDKLTDNIIHDVHSTTINATAGTSSLLDSTSSITIQETNTDMERYAEFGKLFENTFGMLPENIVDWLIVRKKSSDAPSTYDTNILDSFERAFKRPMFVQEYFRYTNQSDLVIFDSVFQTHHTRYNIMRDIYESYTMVNLTEYGFVKNYLTRSDEPNFIIDIVSEIIESENYKTCMETMIALKHKSLYDDELDQNDIAYIFTKVKSEKISRTDDRLTSVINNVKNETDLIISHIFTIFIMVYERQPDIYEIDKFVAYYRSANYQSKIPAELDVINKELERILMDSLEFHDIIKKKVKTIYAQLKSKDILPSIVFQILQCVTAQITILTMSNIDDFIKDSIQRI